MRISKYLSVILAMVVLVAPVAQAQVNSSTQSVNLSLSVSESLTLSATPGNITFNYNSGAGTASASGPITVSGSYNLNGEMNISVFAWLGSATQALASGTNFIPSSSVFASINGGTAGPCNNSAASTLGANHVNGGVVDGALCTSPYINQAGPFSQGNIPSTSVLLSLQSIPNLKAGTYTGVLNFQASAW